jgi:hypothetical protein
MASTIKLGAALSQQLNDHTVSRLPAEQKEAPAKGAAGFNIELTLTSGQRIQVQFAQRLNGSLKHFSIASSSELSSSTEQQMRQLVRELGHSVSALFAGSEHSDLFAALRHSDVKTVDLQAWHNQGNSQQQLSLQQQRHSDGALDVDGQWQQRQDNQYSEHGFDVFRRGFDQAALLGHNDLAWLQQQIQTSSDGLAPQVSSFFESAMNALLQRAEQGQQWLQRLGSDAASAQQFIAKTVEQLAQPYSPAASNALPDFRAEFFCRSQQQGKPPDEQLALKLTQTSFKGQQDEHGVAFANQIRRLDMWRLLDGQQQHIQTRWQQREEVRHRYDNGVLTDTQYRLDSQWQQQRPGQLPKNYQVHLDTPIAQG